MLSELIFLVYPGFAQVLPSLIRICPAPFDGKSFARDSVVSNLTDRPPSLEFVRSAFDVETLANLGITLELLKEMAYASALWCESAWREALASKRNSI